ncbi:ABC transporter substrate-binding protein [Paenibacillus xylaniclasticus]|uniref:ABC transporter substrate-binding protein n=1 Tax=Paenibacillus xylaniclasticus TaxID=588083 RepID=UPI001FE7EF45|nr:MULTISPECIES: ABC transporter substrate-binding protein [Paenibacillus]
MNNHNKLSIVLMSILILAMFLSACGSKDSENTGNAEEKVVTDSMGHQVTIPANPQRVIASYLEDHLTALGVKPAAQWSVANGIQDYLQSSGLEGIPKIGYDLPVEQVMSFSPDLIIVSSESSVAKDKYDQLSKIAPTYVLGDAVAKDWRAALKQIGELLNKSDEAAKAVEAYEAKAAEAKAKLEQAAGGQSAAALWLVANTFYIVDAESASGKVLYEDLGLKQPNVVAEMPDNQTADWNKISLEKLAELDADHIFLVNSDQAAADSVLNDSTWKNLPAVKAGHLYELPATSSWLYSGSIANAQTIDDVLAHLVK